MSEKIVKHEDVIQHVIDIQNGSYNLYDIMFKKCGQIITFQVKKYLPLLRKYRLDVDDFKQHLNLSFIECINKFPKEHQNFIAYTFTYLHNSSLQYIPNDYNGENRTISLNVVNDKKDGDEELIDSLIDTNALYAFDELEDKIIKENARKNIKNILKNMVSEKDIEMLYYIYGLYGVISLNKISDIYNITVNELICWERLVILTIQTHKKIDDYYEQLMTNVSSSYNYTYSRWKYTHTSSTEHIAINNIYIENKIVELKERVSIGMKTLHKNIANATPDCNTVRIRPNCNKKGG